MPTRHDVSAVPLQGGYIAKQCPVKIQWDILKPAEKAPVPEMTQARMTAGVEFEAGIAASLEVDPEGRWVIIGEGPREEMVAATVAAMDGGAEAIFGGWLPADFDGRRVGKPDVLVFAGDGYVPVDVKHHLTLNEEPDSTVNVSEISSPAPGDARTESRVGLRKHKGDALQLAHYRRMLQASGHSSESSKAGIIGKEGLIVWYDLDEQMWQTPAKSDGKKRKMRTAMEVYDFEFDFRLDIGAVALEHDADSATELLVLPLQCDECGGCGWREHCGPIIADGSGDPSLLPDVTYPKWAQLREQGITDRAGVAALHYPTAQIAAEGLNATKVLSLAADSEPDADSATLTPRSKKQAGLLVAAGLATVADVTAALDPTTAAVAGSSYLPKTIIHARAALGAEPAYRLPFDPPEVPRFDIELDVDMENGIDGLVYLWGVLVTDRTDTGLVESGYIPFITWDPLDANVEYDLLAAFWHWAADLRKVADKAGMTVGAYYWSEAESRQIRRITADTPLADAAEALVTSESWVDLLPVYRCGWTNGNNASLKTVAATVGYSWDVDDPDGGESMVKHLEAVAGDEIARAWLLDYNRGDVEATKAVREWMDGAGMRVPVVPTE